MTTHQYEITLKEIFVLLSGLIIIMKLNYKNCPLYSKVITLSYIFSYIYVGPKNISVI